MGIGVIERERRDSEFCGKCNIKNDELCRWGAVKSVLHGSQKSKAIKFNKLKLIEPKGDGTFICKPILGYNITTYMLKKIEDRWTCNCQFFVKNRVNCSHILGLFLYFRNRGGEIYE